MQISTSNKPKIGSYFSQYKETIQNCPVKTDGVLLTQCLTQQPEYLNYRTLLMIRLEDYHLIGKGEIEMLHRNKVMTAIQSNKLNQFKKQIISRIYHQFLVNQPIFQTKQNSSNQSNSKVSNTPLFPEVNRQFHYPSNISPQQQCISPPYQQQQQQYNAQPQQLQYCQQQQLPFQNENKNPNIFNNFIPNTSMAQSCQTQNSNFLGQNQQTILNFPNNPINSITPINNNTPLSQINRINDQVSTNPQILQKNNQNISSKNKTISLTPITHQQFTQQQPMVAPNENLVINQNTKLTVDQQAQNIQNTQNRQQFPEQSNQQNYQTSQIIDNIWCPEGNCLQNSQFNQIVNPTDLMINCIEQLKDMNCKMIDEQYDSLNQQIFHQRSLGPVQKMPYIARQVKTEVNSNYERYADKQFPIKTKKPPQDKNYYKYKPFIQEPTHINMSQIIQNMSEKFQVDINIVFLESVRKFILQNLNILPENKVATLKIQLIQYLISTQAIITQEENRYIEYSEITVNGQQCDTYNLNLNGDLKFILNVKQCKSPIIPIQYYSIPNQETLDSYSSSELRNVRDFSIYNSHGSITWINPVNLNYINFNEIVLINSEMIELYNINQIGAQRVPKWGYKLNSQRNQIQRIHENILNQAQQQFNINKLLINFCQLRGYQLQNVDYQDNKFEYFIDKF